MLVKVNGVGNQRIKYKDHTNIQFDTLDTYLVLAKKMISKFANSVFVGLAKKMLKDEDAIAAVANAIMMADWRWDENYNSSTGTKKNQYSYRNQCAIWAIQTYATKNHQYHGNVKNVYSLDHKPSNDDDMGSVYECIKDHSLLTPEDIAIDAEYRECVTKLIDNIMNLEILSDKQKDYIRLYYLEGQTFEKIGKKYGITREAVRQGLNKAISMIKELFNS